jgi:ribonucleoside-diphosphate reductase alpha chain
MGWSNKALFVWENHYYRGDLGETKPEDVNKRIVKSYEKHLDVLIKNNLLPAEYKKVFNFDALQECLDKRYVMFNSPIYYNLGVEHNPMLFGCWISDLDDSMDGIMQLATDMAIIFKYGGGVGAHIGNLRPEGGVTSISRSIDDDPNEIYDVGSKGASGPISFMELYNVVGRAVKSGGKRRAAILMSMRHDHPDIRKFISCKTRNPEKFDNMNISVMADSSAFIENKKVDLNFNSKIWDTVDSFDILEQIAINSHSTGCPGVLFDDKINEWNFAPNLLGKIVSPNPCGEIVSNPYTSCNLMSINLYELSKQIPDINDFFKYLGDIVDIVFPFLDLNIDIGYYPSLKFEKASKVIRNVGLGISGFAEMLFHRGVGYGSKASAVFASTIMRTITTKAYLESSLLGKLRPGRVEGDYENLHKFIFERCLADADDVTYRDEISEKALTKLVSAGNYPLNRNVTTIAPTGNTGIAMDTESTGMEPVLALKYKREVRKGNGTVVLDFVDPEYEKSSEKDPDIFVTAHTIPWEDRLDVQAAFQKYTTTSISSTINLNNNATVEDVIDIYKKAATIEIKGLTIYRDGSHEGAPIQFEKDGTAAKTQSSKDTHKIKYDKVTKPTEAISISPDLSHESRPDLVPGQTYRFRFASNEGNYTTFVVVNKKDGQPIEIFIITGKSGNVFNAVNEALGRVVSLFLQRNGNAAELVETLIGIRDGSQARIDLNKTGKKQLITSIPDAIAKILLLDIGKEDRPMEELQVFGIKKCPKCKEKVKHEEGCVRCTVCDWGRC